MSEPIPLPPHYPSWWCCPVGKPRVVKDAEDRAERDANAWRGRVARRKNVQDLANDGIITTYYDAAGKVLKVIRMNAVEGWREVRGVYPRWINQCGDPT